MKVEQRSRPVQWRSILIEDLIGIGAFTLLVGYLGNAMVWDSRRMLGAAIIGAAVAVLALPFRVFSIKYLTVRTRT